MFSTQGCWTVAAFAALAAVASAQFTPVNQPMHPANGKISPKLGDAGYAMCFGDGSGSMCPARNVGKRGRGCENSLGMGGGLMSAGGVARVSQDSIALDAQYLPRKSTALFLQGTGCRNQGLGLPFGDGLMCLGGSVIRLGAVRVDGGAAMFPPRADPASTVSVSMAGRIPPRGGERFYQVMYRDENPYGPRAHFNLTNAWSMTWVP